MHTLDQFLCRLLLWAKSQPLLYRFTLGTKILLALGFIPTGAVKLMGLRFAPNLSTQSEAGSLFEILYQSTYYWAFLGLAQVLAGLLILWERSSALGAVLFAAIISNIFLITVSYEFSYTWVVSLSMLLAAFWLIFWEWARIRPLFFAQAPATLHLPQVQLSGIWEKGIYATGLVAGLVFCSILRGLVVPMPVVYVSLLLCLLALLLSLAFGIRYRKRLT
ncbi:hypothetical protein QWY31_03465 [Cytophagales bacterium LB-30]|uniref:Uncharacterized protein n=2 Tax=Shiella aurantiaca TaxID=3058365 RepID=A0ABT8F2D9_9BACT|nr:hypothetical protein [Shiella aurantiaca]